MKFLKVTLAYNGNLMLINVDHIRTITNCQCHPVITYYNGSSNEVNQSYKDVIERIENLYKDPDLIIMS